MRKDENPAVHEALELLADRPWTLRDQARRVRLRQRQRRETRHSARTVLSLVQRPLSFVSLLLVLLGVTSRAIAGWAEHLDLNNLVPYTHPSAAWSDRHSNVAIAWTSPQRSGLQHFHAIVGWGGTKLTDRLLGWRLTERGKVVPLKFQSRNYRPDKVIETDVGDDLELKATAAYPDRNTIAVEFDITNRTVSDRQLLLTFDYPGKGVPPDWEGPFPAGHFVSRDNDPEGSWSTLYVHHEHGRNYTWVKDFVSGMSEGTTLEMVCLADLSDRNVRLGPNSRTRLTVVMGFGGNRAAAWKAYRSGVDKVENGWTPALETARWLRLIGNAPELPARYRGHARYERMYAHAIAGLNSLFIRGDGGYIGEKRIPYTTKFRLAVAFFWDTAFSCVGAREFDTVMAQEALEAFADNAGPRGSLPGTLCETHRAGEGQAPIMVWSAWSVYERSRDKAWLGRMYPALAGSINFWFKYHSSPRGLAQYFNAGQIADNDARFDPVYGRPQGNEPLRGFESPDLNAFLVNEMRLLGRMASELGNQEEAAGWRERASRLAQLIVEATYFPEDSMFYDVKEGTHEKFSGVKNPNMFLPLWAGVPLATSEVKKIVEQHMLNPDEFFREMPFPSLSYDNPKYDPGSYWRGRIWPHVVYWMIQTLWRTGYHEQADLTAQRLLAMFERTPWFMENYVSSPEGFQSPIGKFSHPEYNWSHATVIELLLERYKEPPAPEIGNSR